jgi:hypothetical protein
MTHVLLVLLVLTKTTIFLIVKDMFDIEIQAFLNKKKPGTRVIYNAGLKAFEEFYLPKGSIPDFLDSLEADRDKGWRETKHVATDIVTEYVTWLQTVKKFKRKTTRSYVGAIQQLAKYNNLTFSTRDTKLPVSNPDLKKYPWTLDDVVKFFNLFDLPLYRAFGVLVFQSFFDCSTTLSLTYSDIKQEYEAGTIPLCLDTERFKTAIPFCSFIGKWGVKELHKWLDTQPNLKPNDSLFPVPKQSIADYFRKKSEVFLGRKFEDNERSPCGSHSLRAGGSTLARDNTSGNNEQVRAVDRYLDFFMGKCIAEEKRVYSSKSKEGWRETWRTCVEPYVTPKTF